jgi:hypothetical protein
VLTRALRRALRRVPHGVCCERPAGGDGEREGARWQAGRRATLPGQGPDAVRRAPSRRAQNAIYSEIVNLRLGDGTMRRGQVLEVDGDRAVVQARATRFGGTACFRAANRLHLACDALARLDAPTARWRSRGRHGEAAARAAASHARAAAWRALQLAMCGACGSRATPLRDAQVFEGTSGIDTQGTSLEFTGEARAACSVLRRGRPAAQRAACCADGERCANSMALNHRTACAHTHRC